MKNLLPPKPNFHPNDSFRAMQSKVDAFYNDLERIFQNGIRVTRAKDESGAWVTGKSFGADFEGLVIGCRSIVVTDEEFLAEIGRKDPELADRVRQRLEKGKV